MKYKYVFFDFNGTILDDTDLCLRILNNMLKKRSLPEVSLDRYRHIFGFPIIEYYKRAGLTFDKEPFSQMAEEFIEAYQPNSLKCPLYDGLLDILEYLREKESLVVLLSASEIHNLREQVSFFKLDGYFDYVLGTGDIYAHSKLDVGKQFIKQMGIKSGEAIMIGDTLHDKEVADSLGMDCILVANGHQAFDVLSVGENKVVKEIKDILKLL